ncbi:MAG TPA: hypothetical protein QF353_04090 [Gammaproteobacteria bacterium]|nr:hypothetical protein [Gammaproteobacteria bacterium]
MTLRRRSFSLVGESNILRVFESPVMMQGVFSFLDKKDADQIIVAIPSAMFAYVSFYHPEKCTYEQIQKQFGLYPLRSKRGATDYDLYLSAHDNYPGISQADQNSVNFLVVIPVPYLLHYELGMDRSPLDLIEVYLRGVNALHNTTDELDINFVRKRVRVLLLLNAFDNHFDKDLSTALLQKTLNKKVKELNKVIVQRRYPAWVMSSLWGLKGKSNDTVANCIREFVRYVTLPSVVVSPLFPFAKIRQWLMGSGSARKMYQELGKQTYIVSGDADVDKLTNEGLSGVFTGVLNQLNKVPRPLILGGAYGFLDDNVRLCLRKVAPWLDELSVRRSILMTQLLQGWDVLTRKWLGDLDSFLPYMSEANSFYQAKFLYECLLEPLKKRALKGPDIGPNLVAISRGFQKENKLQRYCWQEDCQVKTSSRHDIIMVVKDKDQFTPVESSQVKVQVLSLDFTLPRLYKILKKIHNHQFRSGMSWVFSNAGWGRCFHEVISLLPIDTYPYAVYFLTRNRKNLLKRREQAKKLMQAIQAGQRVELKSYVDLRESIGHMVKDSDQWRRSHQGFVFKAEDVPSVKFRLFGGGFLDFICSMEAYLRWVGGVIKSIAGLNEEPLSNVATTSVVSSELINIMGALDLSGNTSDDGQANRMSPTP